MANQKQQRSDVLCGQINLHRGGAGTASLVEYLRSTLHTGPSISSWLGVEPTRLAKDRIPGKVSSFLTCVQEPPCQGKRVVGFGNFHNLFYASDTDRPRTAIFASRDLNLWPVSEFTSQDLTTCLWKREDSEIFVASAYMDIDNREVVPDKLKQLLRHCRNRGKELILCADTNAHSTLWGCESNNSKGDIMEDWIFQYNLSVHNTGSHFTFFRAEARTIVDVTMTMGPTVGASITDWTVTDAVMGSDHLLLEFRITISTAPRVPTRNFSKGDWTSFQAPLEERSLALNAWETCTKEELDRRAEHLDRDIYDCLNESHPLHTVRTKVRQRFEFNEVLTRWKKKVHACFSNYRKLRSQFAYDQLKNARREYKRHIRRAKHNSWQTFCDETDGMKAAARLNRIIQGGTRQTLGLIRDRNGTLLESPEASIKQVIDTHFPDNRDPDLDQRPCPDYDTNPCYVSDMAAAFITSERVSEAIHTFGSHKAAGPDGFKPCVLQHLGPVTVSRLTNRYKASYLLGYMPKVWRKSRVIFIPKAGKSDYSEARSFRPITLTSFMVKTLERVVLWHINGTYLQDSPLSINQHAFRSGRSTETALTKMVGQIEDALRRNKYALGVFLDIQGAFDNVGTDAIIQGMRRKNFDDRLIAWYAHYLNHRLMEVDHNGVKVTRRLTKGTPQGGVLSPTAWNLVFEGLLGLFEDLLVHANGFADDAGLLAIGDSPSLLMSRMQHAVDKALEWGNECGLTFSPPKTIVVLFNTKHKPDTMQDLVMNGVPIKPSRTVKYLGVTLDSKLSWRPHVDSKIKASKFKLLRLRNSMGKVWGTNPALTRWLYRGVVRPALTYGAIVWAKVCSREWAINALRKVNRLALLFFGYFRRSTPTAGLEVLLHVMPLHIHVQYEACLAINRTATDREQTGLVRSNLDATKNHRNYGLGIIRSLDLPIVKSDRISVTYIWDKKYTLDRYSFLSGQPYQDSKNSITIYTDGSGIDEKFGSGMSVYRGIASPETWMYAEHWHLGEDSSVFQGEVYAILKAAKWVKANCAAHRVNIYADSRAALQAIDNYRVYSQLVYEAKEALQAAASDNEIVLRWVKAHEGHRGNEDADELAKAGAKADEVVDNAPLVPLANLKLKYRRQFIKKWQRYWEQRPDCRQTKIWMPKISLKQSYQLLGSSRTRLSWLVQLLTGHNFMKRHESLVNEDDDSQCRFCLEDDESTYHIMVECPALEQARSTILGSNFREIPLRWSASGIASYVTVASIGSLLDPANICGLAE